MAVCEVRLYNEPGLVHQALSHRLAGQGLPREEVDLPGVFLDDREAEAVGAWTASTFKGPYFADGYLHDDNNEKGRRSLIFRPKQSGRFDVRIAYIPLANRANNVPITVIHVNGEQTIRINQREVPSIDGRLCSLGIFELNQESTIRIGTAGTDGYVIVDGLHLLPIG